MTLRLKTCKEESDTNKALGICKICDKRNIPFNKLNDHSNNCKKIKDIQQDLLKVNQWLIAECQKAARLKDKLHAFNTPSAPERKIKINGAHSIRSSDKEGSLIQECMTPNPRKVTAIEINSKPFATEKKPINGIQNESEKESMGSLKTNAEGPNNSFKKYRKCNSNEHMDGDTKTKEKLLDDKRKIGNDKSTKKGENKRTSMSEDEQAKKPQSQLSSSDEESEKKDPTKKQRFSHFKQYKLPSGNYSNTPERKQSNRIESDNSIRSNTNLEVKDTQTPKIEDSHLQPVKATSVCEEDELQIIDKSEEPIEKVVVAKKGDTAKFLDDMFSDESDDESPKNSVIVDDYHPQPKQSRFASHKIEAAVKDEEKPVIQDKDRSSDEDKKEKESCEEEQLIQTSPTAKISGFASKNSQVIQPQEQPKPSEKMEKKSKLSSEDSCFGDRFDMYEDGDEEQEADDESDEPEPSPPSIFKPSGFNNSKARQAQPIEITKPDVEDFTPTKDVPAETTKPFDLTPALKEDPIVVVKSKETIKESKESEPEPTNLEKVEENERSQPALNLKLDGKLQLQDAPEALPDSPAFLSGLLDNSEDESNMLGGTSKSEKSSQKQAEDNQSVEIVEVPILRPSVSVKVTLSSLREAVPEPKEEKTPGNISFFSLMKRKNEAAESNNGKMTFKNRCSDTVSSICRSQH